MNTIIFNADLNCGSQSFAGSLGIRFTVAKLARVTELGWFDNNGDGMTGTPTFNVYITTVDGATTYASTTFSSGDQGTRYDSGPYRFKSITPVILAPGDYMLWGYGFDANNKNGNSAISAVNATSVSDGGIITLPTSPTYYHGSTGITVPNVTYSTGLQFASFSMMLWAVDGKGIFTGTADASYSVLSNSHTASGNAVFAGTDAVSVRLNSFPSGNARLVGGSSFKINLVRAASGNARLIGGSSFKLNIVRAASGGGVFGGGSSFKINLVRAASGGGCFGGSAGVVFRIASVASGGAVLGSGAVTGLSLPIAASGLLIASGACSAGVIATSAPGGGAAVLGSGGDAVLQLASVASGSAVFGGSADASLTLVLVSYSYSAAGGAVFSGAAVLPALGITGEVDFFISDAIAGEVEVLPAFSFDLTSL